MDRPGRSAAPSGDERGLSLRDTGMARLLLIDISNSRTKIGRSDGHSLERIRTVPTESVNAALLAGLEADLVVLSSVVPERSEVVRATWTGPLLEVAHDVRLGVAVDYPEPATIGADRLANAAAFAARCAAPGVVIDFGTAVTFDIIDTGPRYVGGVIAPGLEVMTEYLHRRTALLPKIDLLEPERAIGRSTREAMLSGAVIGYRGLVKEILASIAAEFTAGSSGGTRPLRVVATGGYAELIAARVPAIREVDPDLTLDGLRIIGNLNLEAPAGDRNPG